MAQKVEVLFIDDLDGSEASAGTVRLGLFGHTYEIDLSVKNYETLKNALAPYIAVARRTGTSRTGIRRPPGGWAKASGTAPNGSAPRYDSLVVRTWAQSQVPPIPVKDRGRIPANVVDLYHKFVTTPKPTAPDVQPAGKSTGKRKQNGK